MSAPLVVLTYPGHFFLTALTVKSYLKYHPTPCCIDILVDDVSLWTWPGYVEDCKEFYKQFGATVWPMSDHAVVKQFDGNGWIRQQMIKLHLDQILSHESFFFTDGDIVFLNPVEPESVPYSTPGSNYITKDNNCYVETLLGIPQAGIVVDNQQVCVSDPGFRTMHKQLLVKLRQHVEQQLDQAFDTIHKKFQYNNTPSVSEWELIENFKLRVLNQSLDLVKYAPHDQHAVKYTLDFFTHQFITCYCTDVGLGQPWLQAQGITGLNQYWHKIEKIHK